MDDQDVEQQTKRERNDGVLFWRQKTGEHPHLYESVHLIESEPSLNYVLDTENRQHRVNDSDAIYVKELTAGMAITLKSWSSTMKMQRVVVDQTVKK